VKKLLLAVLSLSVLTACGGGGGGGAASAAAGTERVGAIQERIEIVPPAAANNN
jgi:hypothetical protein